MPTTHPPAEPVTARRPALIALVLVMGVGPFATDAYIAALPELQRSLQTSAAMAQLTLTTFIVGMAGGQVLLGPLSDSRGRRTMLIASCAAFTVLSAGCAVCPTGPLLVTARLVQGIVAGGGVAIGRAVVTDTYRGDRAAATFGVIASCTLLGPIVAPAAGGLILRYGDWRTVFAALAVLGAAMTVAVVAGIGESLPPERRQSAGLRQIGVRLTDIVRDWSVMRHISVYCLATAGFFSYIGGSSFMLQTAFAISPTTYTLVFTTNAAAMAAASLLFRVLVTRAGAARLRRAGLAVSAGGAVVLLAAALAGRAPFAAVWVLLCVVVAGMGLTVPASTALTQEAGRRSAGTSSALLGGLPFLAGALVTPLTGVFGYRTPVPLAVAMAGFLVAALALDRLSTPAR